MAGMDQLEGCVATVTGAASGIGLATAQAFVEVGMRVLMLDRDEARLAEEAGRLHDAGAPVESLVVDVTDPDAVQYAADVAVERFGKLNVCVNNAGVVTFGISWEHSLADWHHVIDTNLWGAIHGVQAFVPKILASGEPGWVVNTASLAAVHAFPMVGPYTVSKHAVLGLSDALRSDLAGIGAPVGVSTVMPGMTKTNMNPDGTVPASQVATNVIDAMRRGRPYVFTDDHSIPEVEATLGEIIAARSQVVFVD